MRRRRGGREGEKKTKWQQHDVETKRKSEQNIYKGWVFSFSLNYYNTAPCMSTSRQCIRCKHQHYKINNHPETVASGVREVGDDEL